MKLAIAALVLATSVAHAEPDRDVATVLVFGGTVAALPLVLGASTADSANVREACGVAAVASVIVGPSLGRWYARDPAWAGAVTRGLGLGLMFAAARAGGDDESPAAFYVPGALLVATGVVYDLAMTPRALSVVPTVTHGTGGGLAVAGSF